MKGPLFLLFIAYSFAANSQKEVEFFYNKQWELTSKDSAAYVRQLVYDTAWGTWTGPITDFYKSGQKQMTGMYISQKKEGEFIFYYENGVIESRGHFKDNKRAGVWRYYFPNEKLRLEVAFTTPRLISSLFDETGKQLLEKGNGTYFEAYDEYNTPGKIIVTGELKNGQKHGKWDCKNSDGTMIYSEEYKRGELIKGFTYVGNAATPNYTPQGNQLVLPFKFRITERFIASAEATVDQYPFLAKRPQAEPVIPNPINGIYVIVEESARPKGVGGIQSMYEFLGKEVQYPKEARRQGIQGKVSIEFTVEVDGTLTDFRIVGGINPELDAEVMRIYKKYASMHKWEPARQRGNPVPQRMVTPFTFKL